MNNRTRELLNKVGEWTVAGQKPSFPYSPIQDRVPREVEEILNQIIDERVKKGIDEYEQNRWELETGY